MNADIRSVLRIDCDNLSFQANLRRVAHVQKVDNFAFTLNGTPADCMPRSIVFIGLLSFNRNAYTAADTQTAFTAFANVQPRNLYCVISLVLIANTARQQNFVADFFNVNVRQTYRPLNHLRLLAVFRRNVYHIFVCVIRDSPHK